MATDLAEVMRKIVGEKGVFTDAKSIAVFSRDAFYFSPVLKAQLENKRADLIVAPRSVVELQKVVSYAAREGIPVTVRGAGTGNYGQSVPFYGGIVISTHRLNRILDFDEASGVIRVEPGVRMGHVERFARERGWELRCYPSTWATATIGGFVGGGFGG
ncbi:MAG: FAD-binding oxidoreductase, partial [Thermoflexus sp.]|nr:FAD-binding oxidoreductase [Thermoflexus sp.]